MDNKDICIVMRKRKTGLSVNEVLCVIHNFNFKNEVAY